MWAQFHGIECTHLVRVELIVELDLRQVVRLLIDVNYIRVIFQRVWNGELCLDLSFTVRIVFQIDDFDSDLLLV